LDFNPSRFLDDNNELRPTADLSYLPFSTGHRSCVGQNIARNNLFLIFVRFFQRFRVSSADEDIPEMINSGGSFNPDLKPFQVTLKLRDIDN
jgi:cytochrome P450